MQHSEWHDKRSSFMPFAFIFMCEQPLNKKLLISWMPISWHNSAYANLHDRGGVSNCPTATLKALQERPVTKGNTMPSWPFEQRGFPSETHTHLWHTPPTVEHWKRRQQGLHNSSTTIYTHTQVLLLLLQVLILLEKYSADFFTTLQKLVQPCRCQEARVA